MNNDDDPLGPARGVILALGLSAWMWLWIWVVGYGLYKVLFQ